MSLSVPRSLYAVLYFLLSFVLHFVWEHLQMSLYDLPELSFWEGIRICLFATATGDMVFLLTIYAAVAVVHRDWGWITSTHAFRHPATWVLPVLIGGLLAVSFELWAVYTVHRWKYGSMPLLPIVRVGLTPVLQMPLLPIVALLPFLVTARRQS